MVRPPTNSFLDAVRGALVVTAVLVGLPGTALAEPLSVAFPTLDIEAPTEPIGISDGELGVPRDPDSLGAYQVGGNLLLVGHVDWAGRPRVLSYVRSFAGGEPIYLSDGRTYHVEWTEVLPVDGDAAAWADAVSAVDDDVLTLITCTGPFSVSRHAYLDRLVVRAVRDA